MMPVLAILLAIVIVGAADSAAQTRVRPGGTVSGGGAGSATGGAIVGSLSGGPLGVSATASSRIRGGILGSVPWRGTLSLAPPIAGVTPIPAGTARVITAVVENGTNPDVSIHYRMGGWTDYNVVTMTSSDGTNFSGTIPALDVGIRGVEYYVSASQGPTTVTRPLIDPENFPYRLQVIVADAPAPVLSPKTFRMIGFPFEVNPASVSQVFHDDLGQPDHLIWRLGRWNSARGDYDEDESVEPVQRGRGYWVITAEAGKAVDASGVSSLPDNPVSGTWYGTIPLEPGWNQVSSPFAFPVSWTDRIEDPLGGIEDGLHHYTGPGYELVTILQPFEGYWVFNSAAAPRALELPYVEAPTALPAPGNPAPDDGASGSDSWTLSLQVSAGGLADRSGTVGVMPGAAPGYDALDISKPPFPRGPYLSLALLPEGDGGPRLVRDARPLRRSDGWAFPFRVEGDVERVTVLHFPDRERVPAALSLALQDPAAGVAYEVPVDGSMVLPRKTGPEGDRYVLYVGSREWVQSRVGSIRTLPREVALLQSHPNPVRRSTRIRYSLSAPGPVRLVVLDVAGRRVITLLDREMPAGDHDLTWDGRDDRGRRLASGVYYYRLTTDQAVRSKRLLLLE